MLARLGLLCGDRLGPELVTKPLLVSHFIPYGTNTVVADDEGIKITYGSNNQGAEFYLRSSNILSANRTTGKMYRVTYQVRVSVGGSVKWAEEQHKATIAAVTSTTWIEVVSEFVKAGSDLFRCDNTLNAGESIWIRNFSCREVL